MHKAVIFDLGKVLIQFDFARGYGALEGLCDYPAAEIPGRIGSTDLVTRFETGMMEPREFYEELAGLLSLRLEYSRFCEVWSSIFTETLIPENMLQGLARRYRLLALSNTNALHMAVVRQRYPLLRHFHDLVLSYEVKLAKPDPKIFRLAVDRAGCRPEECFYTDDIPAFVAAASAEGIDAVRFESAEQIERELAARGIQWRDEPKNDRASRGRMPGQEYP